MSPETRSAVMARIKGKNTGPELTLAAALTARGLTWEGHARDLPGRPDFVFRDARLVVFVDGEFWHGRKFSEWRDKLSEKWEHKIAATRLRDARNRRQLKVDGWNVIRFWAQEVTENPDRCARLVERRLLLAAPMEPAPGQEARNLVAREHGDKNG